MLASPVSGFWVTCGPHPAANASAMKIANLDEVPTLKRSHASSRGGKTEVGGCVAHSHLRAPAPHRWSVLLEHRLDLLRVMRLRQRELCEDTRLAGVELARGDRPELV